MSWPGKDEPGHCMYCNQPLRGKGVSGYCNWRCEKADEEATGQERDRAQPSEEVAWKQ